MSEPSEFLLRNLPQIEQIIVAICRRSGMSAEEAEEFAAEVKLRLVDDDYAVIRAFQNRSSFEVYIAAVVKRLLLDYRNKEWGKWRTSAEARRLGPLAVDLERLLYRDGRTVAECNVLLAARYPGTTPAEIDRLVVRLPARMPRRKVDLEHAQDVAAARDRTDPIRNDTARRVSAVVMRFLDALPDEDQLIFQLRFHANMTVAQIARALHIEQQLLYRRLYRHFEVLRGDLTQIGISAHDMEELIGNDIVPLDFRWKNEHSRPSGDENESEDARQEEIS